MCNENTKLKFPRIRELEPELGVFLNELPVTYKHPRQRFSVYKADDKETYIGDIRAIHDFFTEEELREAITNLKKKEKHHV